jgi:FlaA1/EpsC-like NDP-sugar epimerase
MKARTHIRNRYLIIGDMLLALVVALGSYVLRLELDSAFSFYLPSFYCLAIVGLVVKPVVYYFFGLYRRLWVYASIRELKLIVLAVTTASVVVSVVMIGLFSARVFIGFPRSVLIIDWMLSLMAVGGIRFAIRVLFESHALPNGAQSLRRERNILIVGAGDAGALVAREMQKNRQLNKNPVGFLDDDPSKQGNQIHGIAVVGTLSDLARVVEEYHIDEVTIAIPSAPGRVVRLVADVCRLKSVPFRTMPGMNELIGGKVNVSRLREVDITDLLRRETTHLDNEMVGLSLTGRTVLITGAGGSIGRELCRQAARWRPNELILLGHGENSIFETLLELEESFSSLAIRPVIADVRDLPRLQVIFEKHRPQVVFHAAAHKHVPLMEANVEEAVTNNVLGTRNIVDVSLAHNVERLVLISSDKAVRPQNVMGATKRLAEMIVLDAGHRSGRAFSAVRFGNVLGSRGSVVPLFKRQIARGGPVTITHPEMRRYFMTIPEAVNLTLQASSMGEGGEVFVLNMGQQVRILDLAEDLIRLSGLEPGRDIEIVFTGIRPGEKLSEDLWDEGYAFQPTGHPDIFRLDEEEVLNGKALDQTINEIIRLAREGDIQAIMSMLDEVIPGSAICCTPPPDLTSYE